MRRSEPRPAPRHPSGRCSTDHAADSPRCWLQNSFLMYQQSSLVPCHLRHIEIHVEGSYQREDRSAIEVQTLTPPTIRHNSSGIGPQASLPIIGRVKWVALIHHLSSV